MCGIAGILSFDNRTCDLESFHASVRSLQHRGPDADGIQVLAQGRVLLGHRRLSIVDLHDRGNQPLSNEDDTIWLSYNGEIYNHVELRQQLIQRGHRFRTNTDSEVIVHAYEEWGRRCVERLNGIFAFGIWDEPQGRLFLARDQVGVKPLFYAVSDQQVLFASQPKAILEYGKVAKRLNHDAMLDYLAYGVVPADRCVFEGIQKLNAAHTISFDLDGRQRKQRYWSPVRSTIQIGYEDAVAETRRLVDEAVQSQLMSDVTVGTCLSGGIDSSLVNAIAAKSTSISSFTIGFPEGSHDERGYAQVAAQAAGSTHREEELNFESFVDQIPALIDAFDEPILFSSAVSYFQLSRLASEAGVKVLLSGDGGDELFAGYHRYRRLHGTPGVKAKDRVRGGLRRCRSWLLGQPKTNPFLDHFARFEGIHDSYQLRGLVGDAVSSVAQYDHTWRYRELDQPSLDPLTRAQQLDFGSFLVDEALSRTDRAGMYFGVEIRVPILDLRVVEFALSLPPEVQLAKGTPKSLLKQCAQGVIPDQLITNRKRGFSAPFPLWIKQLLPQLEPFVSNGYLVQNKLLRRSAVRGLFRQRNLLAAWQALSLELWARHWLAGQSLHELQAYWQAAWQGADGRAAAA